MKSLWKSLLLLFLALLCISTATLGQEDIRARGISKKALKFYEESTTHLNRGDLDLAHEALLAAVNKEPQFTDALMRLGDLLMILHAWDSAAVFYRQLLEIDPQFTPNAYYGLAEALFRQGEYESAEKHFRQFLEYQDISPKRKADSELKILSCRFAQEAVQNPGPFEPQKLGPEINSEFAEYRPAITADGQTLIFTVLLTRGKLRNEDFFKSTRNAQNEWQPRENLGPPVCTANDDGSHCISPDGKFLYFPSCYRKDTRGRCDIYYSKREGDQWSEPRNIGPPINTRAWESQPSISADGRSLYFVSTRQSGLGGSDIYVSHRDTAGRWSQPQNLGPTVNTPYDEWGPFIHPDHQSLYFASEGHPGLGGFDLFVSRKENNAWQKPVNLGYPINTHFNENDLSLEADGSRAYFSTDKDNEYNLFDIYEVQVHDAIKPQKVTYVKGRVMDEQTKAPVPALIELIDLSSGNTVTQLQADKVNGSFLVTLPIGKNYAYNVSHPGYLFFSENFSLAHHDEVEPYHLNIELKRIEPGKKVVLKNIFFETDSYQLRDASKAELQRLIDLLNNHPGLRIEITGHTDNQGAPDYNLQLSEQRARAVFDYLTATGIARERLTYKGFGETQPIAPNDTEAGRAKNRRTEFQVME